LAIEHVEYGKEADPDHQNSIIDQLNVVITDLSALDSAVADLELQIIGKAELCTDLPADTGASAAVGSSDKASPCDHRHKAVGSEDPLAPSDTAAPGTATLASREDHVHPAVSQLLAGANITLDPAEGKGAVTVSAEAGGTTISTKTFTITNQTVPGNGELSLGTMDIPDVILGMAMSLTFSASAGFKAITAYLRSNVETDDMVSCGGISWGADASGTIKQFVSRSESGAMTLADTALECYLQNFQAGNAVISSGTVTVYYL